MCRKKYRVSISQQMSVNLSSFLLKTNIFTRCAVLLYNYRQSDDKELDLVPNTHLIMGQHLARSIRGRPVSPPFTK